MNLWHHDDDLSKKCGTEHKEKVSCPFVLLWNTPWRHTEKWRCSSI